VTHRRTRLDRVAAALFVVGLAAALALTGGRFWQFALAWLRRALSSVRIAWLTVMALVIAALPILAFEGGLFVLPAALVFVIRDITRGCS
jgi:hypothetical protein